MASTILGKFPIINKQYSEIDEYGIERITYIFTVKTEDASKYAPKKDTIYSGPTSDSTGLFPVTSGGGSAYKVTHVDRELLNGGLTQIVVKTAGSKDLNSVAVVRILPGFPLIFGLFGYTNPTDTRQQFLGSGKLSLGFAVQAKFITANDIESEGKIFRTYSGALMPSTINGASLPIPSRQPFSYGGPSYPKQSGQDIVGYLQFISYYGGFLNREIMVERFGGVSLFTILWSERGSAYEMFTLVGGQSTPTYYYNITE